MPVYRPIHISFWQDKDILKLTPEQKYFYLYLLTNSKTKQCGIFDLPKNIICFETGYNIDTVNKLLQSFVELDKILYNESNEEIFILNWIKYNPVNNRNIMNCVLSELSDLKTKKYIEIFQNVVKSYNKGEGREGVKEGENKIWKSIDFSQELLQKIKPLLSPLQAPTKRLKAKSKTESKSQSESPTESESKSETKSKVVLPEKAPAKPLSLQSRCQYCFEQYYLSQKGINYYFDGKQAGALKDVLKKLRGIMNNKSPSEEELFHAFGFMLENINDPFVLNNLDLSIINSQFNKIIAKIKNGDQSGKGFSPNPTKWDRVRRNIEAEELRKTGQAESIEGP